MRRFLLTSAALAAFAALPVQAATIVNGGFDATPAPNPFQTVNGPDNTTINGWTVNGSVDWIGNYWQAKNGTNSIDLAGTGLGSISQSFATLLGQTYRVTFWIGANPDAGVNPRTGFIDVGGVATKFAFTNTPFSRANMNWQKATYDFVGNGGNMTLRFAADPATSQANFGVALDAVSMAAVPEPATWAMMIMGFGLIGGALRSRKTVNLRFAAA